MRCASMLLVFFAATKQRGKGDAMATLVGDELLVAVFARFGHDKFKIADECEIIQAFYKAKNDGDFDELFQNYPFDNDGLEPTCRELSEAINALQQARLLGRMNPDLVNYTISPALINSFEKYIKPRLDCDQSLLDSLANKVWSFLVAA